MSSIDTDDAIDKLAEYRTQSKKTTTWDKKPESQRVTNSPIRQVLIKYYWINVVITATLGFSLLIAGVKAIGFVSIFLAALAFLLSRQTMKTIERLDRTNSRHTTIDDMFIILLTIAIFFAYLLFIPLKTSVFIIIHSILTVIWVLQIIFVNYRKPDFGSIATQKVESIDNIEESMQERIINFFTKDRLFALGISLILGIFVALPVLLS